MAMVAIVSPLPVGNALRVQLTPPTFATLWNLLRNTVNAFAGPDDPNCTLVAQSNAAVIYDAAVTNGVTYYYLAYFWNGTTWTADDASASGVPASSYVDQSTDAFDLLRARLDYGIQNEIAAGRLTPGENANNVIAVLVAPPIFEQVQFPVIVVHLASESPAEYGLGEQVSSDNQDTSGQWTENEGYLARTTLNVTGWALNPDVRIALRKAIRRVLIANNQVFAAAGLRQIEFSQTDEDELSGTYGAPVYFTVGTFACLSPLAVGGHVAPISDVTVTVNPVHPAVAAITVTESIALGSH
jgi:hypothetical protein